MIGATVRAPALAGVHHLKVAGAGPGPVAGVVLSRLGYVRSADGRNVHWRCPDQLSNCLANQCSA